MLRENGVDVYGTVNGRKGKLNNMVEYFENEANNLIKDYNRQINGLFIRNPGTKGYTVAWYNTVFEKIRSKSLLIGVEGYKNRYNVNVAANVDLIVTFRDDIAALKNNCGSQGQGVYCTNNKLTEAEIDAIYDEIDSGAITKTRFAAIITYVT